MEVEFDSSLDIIGPYLIATMNTQTIDNKYYITIQHPDQPNSLNFPVHIEIINKFNLKLRIPLLFLSFFLFNPPDNNLRFYPFRTSK
jgi:hypothetical protein